MEKDIKDLLIERFGNEKVENWQKQFAPRKLSVIVVEDKLAVLRPITASELGQFSVMVAGEDGLETACRYILSALWIDGDNCLRDDEEYFMGAMLQVQNAIELKKSAYYKL